MGRGRVEVVEAAPDTARALTHDADEVNHLVCCRGTWETTLCGLSAEHEPINLDSRFLCTMCVEEATRQYGGPPEWGVCPLDRTPCPEEAEIDVRISWEIS